MTKVITRYFNSVEDALSARSELVNRRRVSTRIITLYDSADGLADTLKAANVDAKAARTYQDRVKDGGAVLMVRAGYKPLGVAKTTREVTAAMGAIALAGVSEETDIKEALDTSSVLKDHPLMLSRPRDPYSTNFHMANWPIPLISRREPTSHSMFPPHARMASFPVRLISKRKPFTGSVFSRHARMANFPIGLISKRKPFTGSIFSPHARMANFPIGLISKRKPFTGSVIGRHTRMANWPFPHLINGKRGTNALVPGGARMANFPISLLSRRKPFTGSIFSRHARMANFPISLISRRKPFTGSAFPRHARMADFILPLIIRKTDEEPKYGSQFFSLSRTMGIPTLIRR